MPYLQTPDRHQITFMNKLDDLVAPDHPVRLLDALIDQIIVGDPGFFDHLAAEESPGRRGYRAGTLIKLLLYGYIQGISSSRRLQGEAERNIEVIWLLSNLKPSYKTIADYRKDHGAELKRVHDHLIRFLFDGGWIQGKRVAVDGSRIKAYTGWDMPDEEELQGRLQRAHEQLDGWLTKLAEQDALEDAGEEVLGIREQEGQISEQIGRLHERIEELEAARARLEQSGQTRIPLSDPQARMMRMAHGGKPPGYNLQIGVDHAHGLILATALSDQASDSEQLLPMYGLVSQGIGKAPEEVLADTGYADLGDIQQIQRSSSTRCYIPENERALRNRRVQFRYEPEADQYRCSAGRVLKPVAKGRYNRNKQAWVDLYRGTECPGCPLGGLCTKAADRVRQLTVFHGAEWRHAYQSQLKSRYGKARVAERKGLVEHVFGTLRYRMGQIPIKLRGRAKATTEMFLYTSGYNLTRWFGLGSFRELMDQIKNWSAGLSLQTG